MLEPINDTEELHEALLQQCEIAESSGVSKGTAIMTLRLLADELFDQLPEAEKF